MPVKQWENASESRGRRSVRLQEYDYASPSVYFVTLCASGRRFFFKHAQIRHAVEACWLAIPDHNPGVTLDEWVVMPNHIHGLIEIHESQGGGVQLNAPTTKPDDLLGKTSPVGENTSSGAEPTDIEIMDDQRRGVQLNAPTRNNIVSSDEDSSTDHASAAASQNRFSAISPRTGTLSVIIRTYKAAVTTACRGEGYINFQWQRGYYEHVLRNARELDAIRRYIRLNALHWDLDRDNPANRRHLPSPVTMGDYLADLEMD